MRCGRWCSISATCAALGRERTRLTGDGAMRRPPAETPRLPGRQSNTVSLRILVLYPNEVSLTQKATHWFVTCVPREQIVYALRALAATGQVELEQDIVNVPLPDSRELRGVDRGRRAADSALCRPAACPGHRQQGRHRPAGKSGTGCTGYVTPLAGQAAASASRPSRPAIGQLHNLELLREAVDGIGDTSSALADFSQHSSFLTKRLYACPNTAEDAPAEGNAGIVETYQGLHTGFISSCACRRKARRSTTCFGCAGAKSSMSLTGWEGTGLNGTNACPGEIRRLTAQMVDDEAAFQADQGDPALLNALREFAVLRWYLDHTVMLTQDGQRCHVAGWTSASSPAGTGRCPASCRRRRGDPVSPVRRTGRRR